MPNYYRSDNGRVQVSVPGVALDTTSWDAASGGDVTASSTNYSPGGMQPSIALGGIPTRSNMTVERIWSDFLIGIFRDLDAACGESPITISYTVLRNGIAVPGSTISYTGVLTGVQRPNYDSSSAAEAKLQLTADLNRTIS